MQAFLLEVSHMKYYRIKPVITIASFKVSSSDHHEVEQKKADIVSKQRDRECELYWLMWLLAFFNTHDQDLIDIN